MSTASPLARYGWDERFAPRTTDLVPGRVVRVDRSACEVVTAEGRRSARVRKGLEPCTGDWVGLAGDGSLAEVLPRRTALVRGSGGAPQVLAANVDVVAVVVSLSARLALGRVERLLALAWESGARPVVVLTKADLSDVVADVVDEVSAAAPGAPVVAVSATDGSGLDPLRAELFGGPGPAATAVLVGPSGAGKSTLANALLGTPALATGDVRASDGKGRHTTVRRELHALPGGGVLIDTPGLRAVGLHGGDEGVRQAFAEVEELARSCRFADCAHVAEPGCAVLAAVEDGGLERRRVDSLHELRRENEWLASRTDPRLRAERRGAERAMGRAQRRMYRERGGWA
ncbi:ribosome small subunit-dependent GTPase A [Actinosynnema pretiosum]|uniref:Small ribosomal subunit biogenesis GTPase RsgA n=1 Tax=Actinosynnema pretiosum TaxID=42197 RepID=A0A290ZDM1_9PSEU|nr:ribosome small subunit-dependent GTPase A [Actinosynnema pretiosum]ATE57072.1 ribosome small subunit-dependent GTPase A [Actinosynnema pretiosum]